MNSKKRIVAFGEIMARFATPGFSRFSQSIPGTLDVTLAGAEASVAVSLARFGINTSYVTALPTNHAIADACIADLAKHGVDTSSILKTEGGRLGTYYYEAGINQRPGQVVYDRQGSAVSEAKFSEYDWDTILKDADWLVLSGITPGLSENAAQLTSGLIELANKKSIRIAFDINFRSKLWRWDENIGPSALAAKWLPALVEKVDLLFCGSEEAVRLLGCADGEFACILEKYSNLAWIARSERRSGEGGSFFYSGNLYNSERDKCYSSQAHQIDHIVDRLGVGDAFAAGLIFGLNHSDENYAISFAAAAGGLAHTIEGDYNLVSRDEVETLVDACDESGRVSR